jgi:hypothetical protein
MAAEGMPFPWRENGDTISLNLGVIWEMSDKFSMGSASRFFKGSIVRMPVVEKRVYLFFQIIILIPILVFIGSALLQLLGFPELAFPYAIKGGDFRYLWAVGSTLVQHGSSVIYDGSTIDDLLATKFGYQHPGYVWPYPPTFNFVASVFGSISYEFSYFIWHSMGVIFILLAVCIVFGFSFEVALFFVATPAVFLNLVFAQSGALASALLLLGLFLIERRPIVAGICIGLLTVKPQLGILIPFALIAGGYWRVFTVATLTAIALLVLAAVVFGVESLVEFLTIALEKQMRLHSVEEGFFQYLVPSVLAASRLLGLSSEVSISIQTFITLAMIVLTIWGFRGPVPLTDKIPLLLTATYLAAPYVHNYDMIALTGALYLILRTKFEAEWTPLSRGIVLLAWLSPLLTILFNMGGAPIAPLILLALLVLTIIRRYNIGKHPPTCGSRKLLQPCGD